MPVSCILPVLPIFVTGAYPSYIFLLAFVIGLLGALIFGKGRG